ncbi:response regulator transcription factor [Litorivita sp. NS0012-18]|uniref:response regulator transcription factor n=1 Tax=Litorivita sp. NS0012-18 TaxID=3127655 RepID=UPI00310BFDA3
MSEILLADDHELVRETIAAYLEASSDIRVVQAADFVQALELVKTSGPFDLVVLDYTMPGMDGLDGLRKLLSLPNAGAVAVMSGTASADVARRALEAGAAGFLPKTLSPDTLLSAVQHILEGEVYRPLQFLSQKADALSVKLTPRERDVLNGICEGKSNKEIARDLGVQEVTIKLHVKTLSRKLDARNRTHAAMIGRDLDLV